MIDKLEFDLPREMKVSELSLRGLAGGIKLEPRKLKEHRWALTPAGDNKGLYVRLWHRYNDCFYKIITRPSAFDRHHEYLDYLRIFFTEGQLRFAKITRMDFAVDYERTFDDFIAGVDLLNKQNWTGFRGKNGNLESLWAGGNDEKILCYDKRLQLAAMRKLSPSSEQERQPRSRIEIQRKGRGLPAVGIMELPTLAEPTPIRPFRHVRTFQMQILPLASRAPKADVVKHTELRVLTKTMGFSCARRYLNQDRHFARNYGKFFTREPDKWQPDDHLHWNLMVYFTERQTA